MNGIITHIFISANAGEPMEELQKVKAIEGLGLEGDRYAQETGAFSQRGNPSHITLIEQEVIDRVALNFEKAFLASETRRNLVVRGMPLNDLVGQEFMIGAIKVRGVELADPCKRPATLLGKPKTDFIEQYRGSGGLRAEVLNTGFIYVGAHVSVTTYTCLLCGCTTAFPHLCLAFYPELRT